ncbi:MAG TPA: condensation domain-containing protein, partial [Candidatus Kapabacteria bacterium]|nr:condensation domain-containing protein [Candidatus Kapabacteria bacterium]
MTKLKNQDKQNIADVLALTPLQEGLLFHYLKDPGSDYYFEQLRIRISGTLETVIFEQAWNTVVESNEMLRTIFRWEKLENPVQLVLKKHPVQWKYYDLSRQNIN